MASAIPVEEVDRLLQQYAQPAPAIDCPLNKAAGRVLRESLVSDRDLPPFDRVMMDGYAVRGDDLASPLFRVTGKAMAGSPRQTLPPDAHSALEVMTGAPLPARADTVIPYEDTRPAEDGFKLVEKAETGQYVHRQGSDFPAGTILVPEGAVFRAVEAGIAASCGYDQVKVSQRPRIAVFGTGDELVPVGTRPEPHQIRQSNAIAIEHALASASFHVGSVGHLTDHAGKESSRLREAIGDSDVVIISGAVSRGKLDWIPAALDESATCIFHGVAQRPGRPMGFWVTEKGCSIFALPGNPVSTLIGVYRHVLPFLQRQQGMQPLRNRTIRLAQDCPPNGSSTRFLPVILRGAVTAIPNPVNNSGDFARLAGTDGFVELPAGTEPRAANSEVNFYPWNP